MGEFKKGQYNFNKDLKTGEEGEEEVRLFLEAQGFKCVGKCNNNKFDLLMEFNRAPYRVEVKTDSYKNTGNMAIEIESRGKPSGLSVTESEFFITLFRSTKELWLIRTTDLKNLISSNNFYLKENGGDKGSNTKFYLINKNDFKSHFKIFKIA